MMHPPTTAKVTRKGNGDVSWILNYQMEWQQHILYNMNDKRKYSFYSTVYLNGLNGAVSKNAV